MAQIPFAVRNAVRKYVRALIEDGIRVQQVFLYGSHAKNRAHCDSDIDVIVISKDFGGKNLLERMTILGLMRHHIPEPVQAYAFTPEEVQNRKLTAFWEEIIEEEAIEITHEVLPDRRRVPLEI